MCGGDQEFTQLYKGCFRAIRGFVLRKIGHREEAESLTQEIFYRVCRRVRRLPPLDDPTAYLWRTAWNAVKQYWRKNGSHKTISLDRCADGDDATAGLMLRDLIDPGNLPCPQELREMQEYIATVVRALPAKERVVLKLRYLDGTQKTWEEIAECLGCSPPTARTRCKKAIERLRKQLERDLGG